LQQTQNDFLRIIAGAFAGTSIALLEHELHINDILVELDRRQLTSLAYITQKPVWDTIALACIEIYTCARRQYRVPGDRRRPNLENSFFARSAQALNFYQEAMEIYDNFHRPLRARFKYTMLVRRDIKGRHEAVKQHGRNCAATEMKQKWEKTQVEYSTRRHIPSSAREDWGPHVLYAHRNLSLKESRALIKLKTNTPRLRNYLYTVRKISHEDLTSIADIRADWICR